MSWRHLTPQQFNPCHVNKAPLKCRSNIPVNSTLALEDLVTLLATSSSAVLARQSMAAVPSTSNPADSFVHILVSKQWVVFRLPLSGQRQVKSFLTDTCANLQPRIDP